MPDRATPTLSGLLRENALSDELPGSLRGGRYTIARKLGEGSQGETFEAIDTTTGSRVALKRFRVRGAKSWKDVELAEREARVLASLNHPSVPRYVDHFEEAGTLCLVTEYIDGESLLALRKRGVRFSEADIIRLLRDTGTVLDYLHGLSPPVIHRDIKPSNVLLRADGSYALIDFGAVRDKMKPEGGSTVVGTFGFMAPEQFQGRAMAASDVYGVGATALSLLTGREPEELPHRGLAIDVRSALTGSNNPALVEALAAMLEPDPDRRAAQIRPLLGRIDARGAARSDAKSRATQPPVAAKSERSSARPTSRQDRRHAERAERMAEREALRDASRGERRQRRHERNARRFQARMRGFEGLPRLIVTVALAIAIVSITLAVRVITPLVLTLLSIALGPRLREAASKVEHAGRKAVDAVLRVQRAMGEGMPTPVVAEVRVEPDGSATASGHGVRVAADDRAETRADPDDREDENSEARERRRSTP